MPSSSIFVIEDERSIARIISLTLAQSGYPVHAFETAEEALNAGHVLTPSLIITDVRLPGIDGVELTRRIRRGGDGIKPDTPVIMISAYREPQEHQADVFLSKPFDVEDLERLVTRLIS